MIDDRPDCYKRIGKKQHDWEFDEVTGIGKCKREGCKAVLDTKAPFKKG